VRYEMNQNSSQKDLGPNHRREVLNILGIVLLVAGALSAGGAIWMDSSTRHSESAAGDNGWKDDTLSPEDSKMSSRQSEMLLGKAGALITYAWRQCAQLGSPEGFAIILALISTFAALGCFAAARRR
jgi:hypothetical protein